MGYQKIELTKRVSKISSQPNNYLPGLWYVIYGAWPWMDLR